jgi:hypothetical protein
MKKAGSHLRAGFFMRLNWLQSNFLMMKKSSDFN